MFEEEEFDSISSFDDSSSDDNTNVDNDDPVELIPLPNTDELDDPEQEQEAIASVPEYDYSFIQQTNQYLYVLVIVFVTYLTLYVFNSLRAFFERI